MNATYQSGSATLALRESGSGLPVLFLHPTPLDGGFWQPLTKNLSGLRAIVPDLRGHGHSELGELPAGAFTAAPDAPVLTMSQIAADILALLDHLSLPAAVFAGCSIGGYVLLELWRQAPQRMRGLAFVCSKPQPDAPANIARRTTTIEKARAAANQDDLQSMMQAQITGLTGSTAQARNPLIVSELSSQATLTPEAVIAVQAGLGARPDSLPTVETITVPLLAIAGGEDTGVTPVDMEAFRAAPGGCEYHLLPDAGHFAAYERPQDVAARISPWLRQFKS